MRARRRYPAPSPVAFALAKSTAVCGFRNAASQAAAKAGERIVGTVEKVVGTVKAAVGDAVGNESLQAEGETEKLKGKVRKGLNQ